MPEGKYYTVTQEREVKVEANSPIEAARLGDSVFNHDGPPELLFGRVLSKVRDRDIVAREDY